MIECCINSDYIKSDTAVSEDPLERYRAYLATEKPDKAVKNIVSIIRRCMEVMGKGIEEVSDEDLEMLAQNFSYLSERSLQSYIGAVRRYRLFITGTDDPKVKGRITYTPEMKRLWDKLKAQGDSPHVASEKVSKACQALKVLEEHGLPTAPGDISPYVLERLDLFLGDRPRKERLPYIKTVGWYVLANTGANPYQDFMKKTSPNKTRETRPCRFEEDLTEWRESLYETDLSEKRKDTLVKAARQALNRLDALIGREYTIETLTKRQIIRLRRESRDIKESTRREYLQALGLLIEFKTGANLVKECRFKFHKVDQRRTFISEDDVGRMYSNADAEERLMLTMGIAEAMRRGEISDMRFSNIKDGNFEFWSKGFGPDGKLSVLPIMDDVRTALDRYLDERGAIVDRWGESDPDAIFLNSYGRPMSGDSLYQRLKGLARRSGVVEFTPHSLRRFAATNMRRNGASITDIACALRHEDPATTIRCYLKDDPEVKAMTLAKASMGLFAS